MTTQNRFSYGLAIYDRTEGTIDYHRDLPMDGVEGGTNLINFLKSASTNGWELCAALRGPSMKGAKLALSPEMSKLKGVSARTLEDPDEISDLIFKKYL